MFCFSVSSTDESNEEIECIPSIYINNDLLQCQPSRVYFDKSDVKNNACNGHEDEIITNIEVFAKKISCDLDDDNPSDEESEDSDLIDTVTKTKHGYVINNNIFVTNNQWNTLVVVDDESRCCAVCDITLTLDDIELHVNTLEHCDNVENHRLLDIYNFTRKINNFYHCGVCNLLIDIINLDDHNETDLHVCNKIHAQNKACDIIEKEESFNDKHNMSDVQSNDSDIFYSGSNNEVDDNDSDECGDDPSYATVAGTPKVEFVEKTYEDKIVTVSYDSWNMITPMTNNKFYCMVCKKIMPILQRVKHCDDVVHIEKINGCNIVRLFENHFIRQIDERFFHCGHCNKLQNSYEIETHIMLVHPKHSVACDDKSTKTPANISDTTISEGEAKNYETKSSNDNKDETNETKDDKKDETNETKDDNKGETIETKDDKKDETNETKDDKKDETNETKDNKTDASNVKIDAIKNDTISNLTINVAPFGVSVMVSLLAYNVTCKRADSKFYCALCNMIYAGEDKIKLHFYDSVHLQGVHQSPFIPNFKHNLIRLIRNVYHCALCNIPVHIHKIGSHFEHPQHIELFNKVSRAVYQPNPFIAFPSLVPMSSIPITQCRPFTYYPQMPVRPFLNIPILPQNNPLPIIVTDAPQNVQNSEIVKKTPEVTNKKEIEDATKEISDKISDDDDFDINDDMYVRYKNFFYKISILSYHTVNETGPKFCLVCTTKLVNSDLKKHIKSTKHSENLKKCKFIEEYKDHLFRQNYLTYHCSICNVVFPKSNVKMHLEWYPHCVRYEETRDSKKSKKTDFETRIRSASLGIDKEKDYPNEKEPELKVHFRMEFQTTDVNKKDKMIIYKNQVFRVKFMNWHSLVETKGNYKCFFCQTDFAAGELNQHLSMEHMAKLQTIVKEYDHSFIRKINDKLVHCVICNSELPNQENIVTEHIKGKKHKKNYEETPKDPMSNDTIVNNANDIVLIID